MRRTCHLASALLLLAGPLAAQGGGTAVEIDVRHRVLRLGIEAELTVIGPDTVRARSDRSGRAVVVARPGRYVVQARAVGFIPSVVQVDIGGDSSRLRIAMEPSALSLDAMVITGARREERLADATITTEVVSAMDIEATGASDVASAVAEQLGIQLQPGLPSGAGVMLQGIGSERVLILVDGQPVAGRLSGLLDLSRIPTSIVDRIEVVKGPQSTLYGSEAMGGVVNILTRRDGGSGLVSRASVRGGNLGRLDGSAGADFRRGSLHSSLDVGRRSIERTPGRADVAGAMTARLDGALSLRWQPSPRSSASASLLAIDERQRWRTGSLYQIGDNRQYVGRVAAEMKLRDVVVVPSAGYSRLDHVLRASSAPAPIKGDTGQRQIQDILLAGLLTSTPVGTGSNRLDIGIEGRREAIRAARVTGTTRTSLSLEPFTQLELAMGSRLTLLPGARLSWNEQWGTHLTPRLAARVKLAPSLTARLSAASGFRAPDFKELYLSFQNESAQYVVEGNPLLRPESSRNLTGSLEWASDRYFARTQVFYNGLRDFIETRVVSAPEDPLLFRYGNVNAGRTHGADSEAGFVVAGLRMEAGYSYLGTRDGDTGLPLLGRPTHSARLLANLQTPMARLTITQLFTGRTAMTRDDAGTVTGERDAFHRTDLRLALASYRGIEPSIGIDNLFDRRPAMWGGSTVRHLYASLAWAHGPR